MTAQTMSVSSARRPVIQVSGIRKTYGRQWPSPTFRLQSRGRNLRVDWTEWCRERLRPWSASRASAGRISGSISILGLDPFRDVYQLQNRIGVQLQQAQLQKRIKVWEAVDLWASLYTKAVDGDRLLEQLGLATRETPGS